MCHPERKGNAVALKSNGSEQFHTIAICSLCYRLTAYSFQHIQLRSLGCARDDSRHPNKHIQQQAHSPTNEKKAGSRPTHKHKKRQARSRKRKKAQHLRQNPNAPRGCCHAGRKHKLFSHPSTRTASRTSSSPIVLPPPSTTAICGSSARFTSICSACEK